MRIIVTGGAGFIGSALVRYLIAYTDHHVLVVDKLTYAGNLASLDDRRRNIRAITSVAPTSATVCGRRRLRRIQPGRRHASRRREPRRPLDRWRRGFRQHQRRRHLRAARSRARRIGANSVRAQDASAFTMFPPTRSMARSPTLGGSPKTPATTHARRIPRPRRPPTTWCAPGVTRLGCRSCSPIVRTITARISFRRSSSRSPSSRRSPASRSPVYGQGLNVRDWFFVDDHAAGAHPGAGAGRVGETYNIGGNAERRNIDVVTAICDDDGQTPAAVAKGSHRDLISFVPDRPGHDFRYAIDCSASSPRELGWTPQHSFEPGLARHRAVVSRQPRLVAAAR